MLSTQSHKNHIVIASAGGRKTTFIVEEALKHKDEQILITTYTNENLDQITDYLIEQNGCIPANITILSWFTFLLREGVWPYQNHVLGTRKVESIDFIAQRPIVKGGRQNSAWYLDQGNYIYKDRVSEFVCDCNSRCSGLITSRLESIYDRIYIDEMQDLVGWDQEFVESLISSSINILLVGDPRQATYSTNRSSKNKSQKGKNMLEWIEKLNQTYPCLIEVRVECFRCNQAICDFADALYPEFEKTKSKNTQITDHDGIFFIHADEVMNYVDKYKPKILRWDRRADTLGLPATNFGASKGRTYDRVLIFPTKPILKYLETYNISHAGSLAKLYVAVTRAKYSVTFVVE